MRDASPFLPSSAWLIEKVVDRLQIHVLDVQCNQPLHAPYVLLTLGPTVYRTSTAQKSDGQWQEAFEFIVGFHGQLFWSIQVVAFCVCMGCVGLMAWASSWMCGRTVLGSRIGISGEPRSV